MKYRFIMVMLLLTCMACRPDKGSPAPDPERGPAPDLEELMTELYRHYHADPADLAEYEENRLIDYAVDNGIPASRAPEGYYIALHEEGQGPFIMYGQIVKVHYKGYFLDGRIFDSSYRKNRPLQFKVGNVIPGWNAALKRMKSGSHATLLIPSRLAYGKEGLAGVIPPDTPLVFEIKVLDLSQNVD